MLNYQRVSTSDWKHWSMKPSFLNIPNDFLKFSRILQSIVHYRTIIHHQPEVSHVPCPSRPSMSLPCRAPTSRVVEAGRPWPRTSPAALPSPGVRLLAAAPSPRAAAAAPVDAGGTTTGLGMLFGEPKTVKSPENLLELLNCMEFDGI